jgi:hypothetical protein
MVVVMIMGMHVNHTEMLYYNITRVHQADRLPEFKGDEVQYGERCR